MSTRKRMFTLSLEEPPVYHLKFEPDHVPRGMEFPSADARIAETPRFGACTGSPPHSATKRQRLSSRQFVSSDGMRNGLERGHCITEVKLGTSQQETSPRSNPVPSVVRSRGWLGLDRHSGAVESVRRNKTSSTNQTTATSNGERGRVFVQLTIDGMFTREVLNDQSVPPGEQQKTPTGKQEHTDVHDAGSMDMESGVNNEISKGSEPSCYVCRCRLASEGGDVLCPFCDRAACQDCSNSCSACERSHCRMCLCTDFSAEFESYYCPPCHRERGCDVSATSRGYGML